MFDWLFKKRPSDIANQPPGQIFPWSKDVQLVAVDDVTLAIPAAILRDDEQMGSVVLGHDEMEIKLQEVPTNTPGACIYLRLKAGMSVSLTKSCDAMVIADDKLPRRIRVIKPSVNR